MNKKSIKLMVVASVEGKELVQNVLSNLEGIEIVGVAYNKRAAIRQLKSIQADVLLIDLMLLGLRSIDVISYVSGTQPDVKILALTPEDIQHDHIILAIQAGVLGYITRDSEPTEILSAIDQVFQGKYYLPLEATHEVLVEAAPDLITSAKEKRAQLSQFVLGLIPVAGLISALTGFLWREYWGQIGVRVVDLGVDATTRVTEFLISFFWLLGIFGPLLFIDSWIMAIGLFLNEQPQQKIIFTKAKKFKLGRLLIGRLLFRLWIERVILALVVLSITLSITIAGAVLLLFLIGAVTALILLAHIFGLKDELPLFLKLTESKAGYGLLSIGVLFLILILMLSAEVFFRGPDLRTDGLHGFLAPRLLDLSARPAMFYDLDEKHKPLGALYLGGNADLYVLYDPCKKTVRFIPVGSSRVELIDEVQCSSP